MSKLLPWVSESMKLVALLLVALLIPTASASQVIFSVNSPQINSKYADYDLSKFYCEMLNDTLVIGIEVWGIVNVDPSVGYIKEYDANISYGNTYLHVYLMSNNGSKAIAYTIIGGKVKLLNYTVEESTLKWFVPKSIYGALEDVKKGVAHGGIVDLKKGKYIFLDTVNYPQEKEESSFPYIYLYAALGIAVAGALIFLWMRKK